MDEVEGGEPKVGQLVFPILLENLLLFFRDLVNFGVSYQCMCFVTMTLVFLWGGKEVEKVEVSMWTAVVERRKPGDGTGERVGCMSIRSSDSECLSTKFLPCPVETRPGRKWEHQEWR